MLAREEAAAALAARREQVERAVGGRPRAAAKVRAAAEGLADWSLTPGVVFERIHGLGDKDRAKAFALACPGLAGELTNLYRWAGQLPYQATYDRRPFRAPRAAQLGRARVVGAALGAVEVLAAHGADAVWLARSGGHLRAERHVSPQLVGWLLAVAIDTGGDEVFDLLIASIDGSDDIATMGQHVPIALLTAERPEGWEAVERLLLSAQREEGLRQTILEVVDEAHPRALERMLAVVLDHDLSRFAAVARATSVWFGVEALAGDRRRIDALAGLALRYLSDATARTAAVAGGGPQELY